VREYKCYEVSLVPKLATVVPSNGTTANGMGRPCLERSPTSKVTRLGRGTDRGQDNPFWHLRSVSVGSNPVFTDQARPRRVFGVNWTLPAEKADFAIRMSLYRRQTDVIASRSEQPILAKSGLCGTRMGPTVGVDSPLGFLTMSKSIS